jgi:uncharacterized protein YuzE
MEITFDRGADAMYIRLRKGKFAKNKKIDSRTIVDLDKKGKVLGIELLEASNWIRPVSTVKIKKLVAAVG